MKTNLAVLFGGRSVEHEISVISALQAMENIDREKFTIYPVYISKDGEMYFGEGLFSADGFRNIPALLKSCRRVTFVRRDGKVMLEAVDTKKPKVQIDVALPVVHGTNVEDGALQGYLRTLGLPFAGCDVLASAVGMDKYVMKIMLREGGFPVLDCVRLRASDGWELSRYCDKVEETFSYPVIVKPVNLGSSVGISKAADRRSLEKAISTAFSFADTVLCERAITALREINCSVLGDQSEAQASECEEPFMCDEILSYKDKYMDSSGGKKAGGAKGGMAGLKRRLPADISPEMREKIRTMATDAFRYLGCSGVSRIDFMIDADTDTLYINEFNTIPGSLAFYLWEPMGISYRELLTRLVMLALKRSREEGEITYSFDTNILSMPRGGAKGSKGSKA